MTERVVEFIHDAAGDPKLCKTMWNADRTVDGWIEMAKSAGYTFGSDDLKAVAEEFVDQATDEATLIPQLADALFAEDGTTFSSKAIERLKAVMQQGRYSGYYRPW